MDNCIFCKISSGEIKSDLIYEDDQIVAFRDLNPQAPIHILIIPREHVKNLADTSADHQQLLGELLLVATKIARELGVAERGFRLVINTNDDGGQTVPHLHVHLLAGRFMTWPPG